VSAAGALAALIGRVVAVRAGEWTGLLAAFGYNFFLFTAYYILRPIRDSMGIESGVENLDDLFGFTFLGMLLAVPLFGWVAGHFRRAVFLPWIYLFFVAQLVAFWALFTTQQDIAATAKVFFVWVSVFNLFVISVFWSFMADLFDKEQGKRLFAGIAAGATAGQLCGSGITTFLAERVGDVNLLLLSAALLASTIALMRVLLGWSARRGEGGERHEERPIGGNPFAGLTRVLTSPYLAGIAAFVFLMAAVNTVLYIQQANLLDIHYPDRNERTAFLGGIEMILSWVTLLLQIFAVGHLTRRAGVAAMIVVVPAFVIAGFLLIAASPVLMTLVAVYIARRVGQYAIVRPCREMLYTTVDRESKYKAKNVNDTLVYRGSDWAVAKGQEAIAAHWAVGLPGMAFIGAGLAALWAIVAFGLGRAHERMTGACAGAESLRS
jgi:AAA family ATP:ADP antiporter